MYSGAALIQVKTYKAMPAFAVPANVIRVIAFIAFLMLVVIVSALATLLSGGAAFLSIWLITAAFGALGLGLLIFLPAPSISLQRVAVPLLMLYVATTVVWPRYATFRLPGMPALSLSRICLLLLLLLGIFVVAKTPSLRQRLSERCYQFRWVLVPLVAWLLLRILGVPFSEAPFASVRGILNEVVTVYAPMFLVVALVADRTDIHRILWTLLAATVVVLALAIYEYKLGRNLFIGILEIDSEYLEQVLRDKFRSGNYRLQSTFSHPLTLSEFLVFAAPLAIYMAFVNGFRTLRVFFLLCWLTVVVFVITKTGSRSGVGGLAAVLSLCVVFGAVRLAKATRNAAASALYILAAVAFVMVAAIVLYFLMEFIVGRTTREFNSGMVRLAMWQEGLSKIADRPLLGYGQDTAAGVLGFVGSHGIITIDSYFLSVLLDGGVFALALYLLALAALAFIFLKAGLSRASADLLSILFFASVVGFSMIKAILSLHHNHGLFMTLAALAMVSVSLHAKAPDTSVRPSRLRARPEQ